MSNVQKQLLSGWNLILIISLVLFLFFFSYFYYNAEKKRILNATYHELTVTSNLKEKTIYRWQQQQLTNVRSHTLNPLLTEAVDRYLKYHPEDLRKLLSEQFGILKEIKEYDNVMLAKTDGTIEISMDPKVGKLEDESRLQLKEVLQLKKAVFGQVFKSSILKDHLYLDIMSPVMNKSGNIIAVLVVRLNPFLELLKRCDLGNSMQNHTYSYVVDENLSSFSILKDSSLLPIPPESALSRALLLNAQQFNGLNANNKKVLCHIQKVNGTDLYLISEIQYENILKSYRRYARMIFLLNVSIIIGLLIAIIFIFQYRQKNTYRSLLNTELAFREEHEKFRITLYSIGDGVITTDEMGFITHMNNVAVKFTGFLETEAQGKQIHEVYNVIDEKTRTKLKKQLYTDQGIMTSNGILVSRNGTEYYISEKSTCIKSEEDIIGSVIVFRDQTSQRASEKALKINAARLRRAERIANIGHWELYLDSNILWLSDSMQNIFGLGTNKIDYNQLNELIVEDYSGARSKALHSLLIENGSYDIEFKIKRPSDNRVVDIHSIAEYDSTRNMVFGIIQEITEFRLAQKKLLQINEELKNSNSTKDRIFSIIAHDLRNPVGNILNLSELMVHMPCNSRIEKRERFIEQINTTAKNAMDLLENLLYWARMQNKQMVFDPQKLFLNAIINEVIDLFESSARLKQIEIKNHVNKDVVLTADSNMLKTILRNLLSNAIKFTNPNGIIEIIFDQHPAFYQISVKDNGVGMNDKKLNQLFRTDTNITTSGTANEKGSGLGLIICKEFVEKHQGKIWAETEEGVGSSFCFTISDALIPEKSTNKKITNEV